MAAFVGLFCPRYKHRRRKLVQRVRHVREKPHFWGKILLPMPTFSLRPPAHATVVPAHGRPLTLDWLCPERPAAETPLVLFAHGFRGFKDWGWWGLAARRFAEAGIAFAKFNLSHNGTTIESPLETNDLEAFAANNYSLELEDWAAVTDWAFQQDGWDHRNLVAIGHSRSGGLALLHAAEDPRITQVVTWASVADMGFLFHGQLLADLQEKGTAYVVNARTGQQMPLRRQFWEDYERNRARFDLSAKVPGLSIPLCLVHGTADIPVPYRAVEILQGYAGERAEVVNVEGADHVFGGAHPWPGEELPVLAHPVVDRSIRFVQAHLRQ
jgi:dienelactone hydrolase